MKPTKESLFQYYKDYLNKPLTLDMFNKEDFSSLDVSDILEAVNHTQSCEKRSHSAEEWGEALESKRQERSQI